MYVDIETDGLDATRCWCVVTQDLSSGKQVVWREPDEYYKTGELLEEYLKDAVIIGHNIIKFDHKWLDKLLGIKIPRENVIDTLVLSLLLDQGKEGGHSLDAWGKRLGIPKGAFSDFSKFSEEMVTYCKQDVTLGVALYHHLMKIVNRNGDSFIKAIDIEHDAMWNARDLEENGFKFDLKACEEMINEIDNKLAVLVSSLERDFPPRAKFIREVCPKVTKHGTISRSGISNWYEGSDYTIFTEGAAFSLVTWEPFNPGSPKQIIDRLWEAGWEPTEKTDGHLDAIKNKKDLTKFKKYGWKVNENNLATLPEGAPQACSILVEYILTAARRRTLEEWRSAYNPVDGRIHGRFNPLGARSHRCTHTNPNMGNIATRKTIKYNTPRLRDLAIAYGGRMRSMWICSDDTYLVGTDMDGAHLRIFAHLINDQEFIDALVKGRKEDGTDPHSVNMRKFGPICVDRDRSKTAIFTLLNGGAVPKLMSIFGCDKRSAQSSLENFIQSYPGLAHLKQVQFPRDADRGYFIGVDGRKVICDSAHLMMGMILQNFESVLMKYANRIWRNKLYEMGITGWRQVNWVHDEWVTEVRGDKSLAELVGQVQADAIVAVGKMFGLRCPMAGTFQVGKNWLEVH